MALPQQQLAGIQLALDQLVGIQRDVGNRQAVDGHIQSTVKELIRQTTQSDGTPMSSVRRWMRDIEIAFTQVGQGHIIRIITATVTGSLRDEIERYIQTRLQDDGMVRAGIPWADVRAHVEAFFLHADEQNALRDELEETRQTAHETDNMFSRRFRELADQAYPQGQRNADQQRIMLKAYVRGLRSTTTARKLVHDGAPADLDHAMQLVAQYAERQDAFDRMRPGEEPMDISVVQKKSEQDMVLDKVGQALESIKGQQLELITRLAKLEADQKVQQEIRKRRGQKGPSSVPRDAGGSNSRGPRCYACHERGHIARRCPHKNGNTSQQEN